MSSAACEGMHTLTHNISKLALTAEGPENSSSSSSKGEEEAAAEEVEDKKEKKRHHL